MFMSKVNTERGNAWYYVHSITIFKYVQLHTLWATFIWHIVVVWTTLCKKILCSKGCYRLKKKASSFFFLPSSWPATQKFNFVSFFILRERESQCFRKKAAHLLWILIFFFLQCSKRRSAFHHGYSVFFTAWKLDFMIFLTADIDHLYWCLRTLGDFVPQRLLLALNGPGVAIDKDALYYIIYYIYEAIGSILTYSLYVSCAYRTFGNRGNGYHVSPQTISLPAAK